MTYSTIKNGKIPECMEGQARQKRGLYPGCRKAVGVRKEGIDLLV